MKLKLTRKTQQRQVKLTTVSRRKIMASLPFFQFMTDLKQFGTWISHAWSVLLTFLLIAVFYITITEKRAKNYLTQLHALINCLDKVLVLKVIASKAT